VKKEKKGEKREKEGRRILPTREMCTDAEVKGKRKGKGEMIGAERKDFTTNLAYYILSLTIGKEIIRSLKGKRENDVRKATSCCLSL